MEKKKISVFTLVFGLAFIALGVFLLLSQTGSPIIMLVSGLDILFGIALIGGSALGKFTKKNDQYDEPQYYDNESYQPDTEPYNDNERPAYNPFAEEIPDQNYFSENTEAQEDLLTDPAQLAARETELRIAAKRAADEAARAKKVATQAVQEAKQAEAELTRAEAELADMDPAEQRTAMRHIDALAQVAAEKSEIAVEEAQRAKLAIRNAREAAELHSAAMDAAASALSGEDEFAEFN